MKIEISAKERKMLLVASVGQYQADKDCLEGGPFRDGTYGVVDRSTIETWEDLIQKIRGKDRGKPDRRGARGKAK